MSEVMLKAARLAYPEFIWRDEESNIVGARRDRIESLGDSIRYMAPEQLNLYFNARFDLDSGDCVMALQIALEWKYKFYRTFKDHLSGKEGGIIFVAEPKIIGPVISAPTKPELLLKCTEATHDRA